jgi:hypothetical protein
MDREDKAYKAAMEMFERESQKKYSREEILHFFVNAGILDKDCNFTAPYQNLAKYVKYTKHTSRSASATSTALKNFSFQEKKQVS